MEKVNIGLLFERTFSHHKDYRYGTTEIAEFYVIDE